jgi:hypothetical protein
VAYLKTGVSFLKNPSPKDRGGRKGPKSLSYSEAASTAVLHMNTTRFNLVNLEPKPPLFAQKRGRAMRRLLVTVVAEKRILTTLSGRNTDTG